MTITPRSAAIIALAAGTLAGCGHLYDRAEEPVVVVGRGVRPVISWTPPDAWELNLYRGSEDGDSFGSIWNAKMGGGYENTLPSPVTFGVPPEGSEVAGAPPLEPGQTYTVVVHRSDPRGTGDGFTRTGHRYIGMATFVASTE